jgi:uncharacterized membrane protein (Fun14 family)
VFAHIVDTSRTWLDTFKQKWNIGNGPTSFFIELVCYLIAGFAFGFLLKHMGRTLIWVVLGVGGTLWLLQIAGVVTINYTMLKDLLGITSDMSLSDMVTVATQWTQAHLPECITLLVGFFLGWGLA